MRTINRLIVGAYTVMMAVIVAVVLLCYTSTSFYFKIDFLLPQGALLALGMALVLGLTWLFRHVQDSGKPAGRGAWLRKLLPWAALFAFQAVVCYHVYALPGMDANIVLSAAYDLATGDGYIKPEYYSTYPNNAFLTLVYGGAMKLACSVFGRMGFARCVLVVILLQCALSCAAGMLTQRVAREMTGSSAFARLAALVFVALVGISPWLTYPYSDSMGLIFPVMTFALYQRSGHAHHDGLLWLLIGLSVLTGYLIKPQTAIAGIAIGLLELVRMLEGRDWRRGLRRVGTLLTVVLLGGGPMFGALVSLTPIEIESGKSVGLAHYLAMGQNEAHNGTYCAEDVIEAMGMEDAAQRRKALLCKSVDRVLAMGPDGLRAHLIKKTLANYADGTFSWGGDCTGKDYYREVLEEKDAVLSPVLRDSIDFVDGRIYPYLKTALHAVWLGLLACSLLSPFTWRGLQRGPGGNALCAMLLAIIGLTVYEWIFEAQSRYLFTFAPLYVIVGLAGAWYAMDAWAKRTRTTRT